MVMALLIVAALYRTDAKHANWGPVDEKYAKNERRCRDDPSVVAA